MERKQETEVQWFCKRKTGKKIFFFCVICIYFIYGYGYTLYYTTYNNTYGKANEDNLARFFSVCIYIYDEEKDT